MLLRCRSDAVPYRLDAAQPPRPLFHPAGDPLSEGLRGEPAPAARPAVRQHLPTDIRPIDGPAQPGAVACRPPPARPPIDRRHPANPALHGPTDAGRLADVGRLRLRSTRQRPRGAVARLRTAAATSAGGIVVRAERDGRSLVVGMRRRERDIVTWTLPKGTPD